MSSASAALTWSSPLFLPQSRHGRVPIHHQSRTCPSLKAPRVDVCGEQRPPAHIAYGGGGGSSSDGLNWRPRQEYPPDHLPHPTSEGLRFLPNQSGERHENPSERREARGPQTQTALRFLPDQRAWLRGSAREPASRAKGRPGSQVTRAPGRPRGFPGSGGRFGRAG